MPQCLIVGVPQSAYRRCPKYSLTSRQWDSIEIVYSRQEKPEVTSLWAEVERRVAAASAGLHVFAFHRPEDEYGKFWKLAGKRFRLVWLDRRALQSYGTETCTKYFRSMLAAELVWIRRVKPQTHDDALLLPYPYFKLTGDFANLWKRAERSGANCVEARAVRVVKAQVKHELHQLGSPAYRDEASLVFNYSGARHGQPPPNSDMKFGYKLPDGFHYDVSHLGGSKFRFAGADGIAAPYHEYVNVSCFGDVRGGR
jgi:hypothetical protein